MLCTCAAGADVMPHLEYDPAYGCFVYDSGQDWWLLLPRVEQTDAFKGGRAGAACVRVCVPVWASLDKHTVSCHPRRQPSPVGPH